MVKIYLSSVTLDQIFAICKKKNRVGVRVFRVLTNLKLCPRLNYGHKFGCEFFFIFL